ncbi:MAG: hypothetical protein HY690_16510 [Chloroflexi bacterium]|nr:hypothetical protein [Chloroflexota bacterium]
MPVHRLAAQQFLAPGPPDRAGTLEVLLVQHHQHVHVGRVVGAQAVDEFARAVDRGLDVDLPAVQGEVLAAAIGRGELLGDSSRLYRSRCKQGVSTA